MITTCRQFTPAVVAVVAIAALVASCTPNLHATTRVTVTQADAGKTLHLKRGDLVVFQLPIRPGRRWTAVSDDENVAKPLSVEEEVSTNRPPATFITVRLTSTGHATLTACPDEAAECSAATPGSMSVEVDVS